MKKLISTMLAAVMISSCIVTPAFAGKYGKASTYADGTPMESSYAIPSIGQQEYGLDKYANKKINAYNTDARVYPTSQAPAMKNTKTINGVTFSGYIKHNETDVILQDSVYMDDGPKIHQVNVWVAVDGAMYCPAKDARFILRAGPGGFNDANYSCVDFTVTTGERAYDGMFFDDLENYDIKAYADQKSSAGTGGEYVGNLTWEFLPEDEKWEVYQSDLTWNPYARYDHSYSVIATANGVTTNFNVFVTTDGTPKGDNTAPQPVGGNSGNTGVAAPAAAPAKTAVANPTASKIFVNGKEVAFDAYNINGNNYFKLRDVALTVGKTAKQFEVQWDPTMIYTNDEGKQARGGIALFSGKAYTAVGGEMKKGDGVAKNCVLTASPITKDGEPVQFTAYHINGNNYFKLRDLGEAFDFNVSWDADLKAVVVNTSESYTADE